MVFFTALLVATMLGLIQGVLTLTSLDGTTSDPYEDPYVRSIFRLSIKEVMQIPKLDDATFLLRLEQSTDDMTGK